MSDLFWLSDAQLSVIKPYFPLSHGVPRADEQGVISVIIHVIKNGLRWRDAPREYGPHKTLRHCITASCGGGGWRFLIVFLVS